MKPQSSYNYDELIACGQGKLFGPDNARLPLPNMLMFHRITHISEEGGDHSKGLVKAELDIDPSLWFFDCHFATDPVMPGCLGLDALWQLLGFFLGWKGNPGKGRALGAGQVKFSGQVLPTSQLVQYEIHIKRLIERQIVMGIANGLVMVDGETIYQTKDLKVGLFGQQDIFI